MITWKNPENGGRAGTDENGNEFYANACREIVIVDAPDGKPGMGWTPEEDLERARKS